MQLSSSARSVVVAAALAATAGFGLGAVFTSHSNDVYTKPASPAVATSSSTYERSHPTRVSPEMRRHLDAKRSLPQTGATAGQGAGGPVRIRPHDVVGP
jgi:hypothetical protein